MHFQPNMTPNMMFSPSHEQQMASQSSPVYNAASSLGSPSNNYGQTMNSQYSPNPSYFAPSPVAHSPVHHQPQQQTNNNLYMNSSMPANPSKSELPQEVMERFDSLDIDSLELLPDLDLNSNTMLNLIMDTSSGLSLTDSFSDFQNGNNQQSSASSSRTRALLNGQTNLGGTSLNKSPIPPSYSLQCNNVDTDNNNLI